MKRVIIISLLCLVVIIPVFAWVDSNTTVNTAQNHTLTAKWLNGTLNQPSSLYTYVDNTFTFNNTGNIDNSRITFTWYVDGVQKQSGSSNTYNVNVTSTGSHTVQVDATINGKTLTKSGNFSFSNRSWTITKSVGTGGSSIDGDTSYSYSPNSQTKTYTANAATGYSFSSWTTTKGSFSGNTLTIPAAATGAFTVTANFSPNVYTITKSNGTGIASISGDDSYTYNPNAQTKTYTATASTGYTFSGWTTGKGSFSGNTLTIPANTTGSFTITANATPNTYNITLSTGANGSVSVSGGNTFTFSTSAQTKTINISPNDGYEINSISTDTGTITGDGNTRTLNIPASTASGITVTTSFKESWYGVALTGASSRTIVFYSISDGTLYTDSACTTTASTNVKYTNQTFYYKSNESKPSASYVYPKTNGANSSYHTTNYAGGADYNRDIRYTISQEIANSIRSTEACITAVYNMCQSVATSNDKKKGTSQNTFWISSGKYGSFTTGSAYYGGDSGDHTSRWLIGSGSL